MEKIETRVSLMKVAIYGAGKYGEYVLREIQTNKNSKVMCPVLIDNNKEFNGKRKYGVPIINIDSFFDSYSDGIEGVLIAVLDPLKAQEMALSLLKRKFSNIFLIPAVILEGKLPIFNLNGDFVSYIKLLKYQKPILPYIEYHVSDFCNLKCKGCGHFSNIVSEKIFPDINEFKKALLGLKKRFKNIEKFRLMGGEPLINPNLVDFIHEVKNVFPYTELIVVTNGLLLDQMEEKVINVIKKYNVVVDITQYPPTRKKIEIIVNFAESNQIKIRIGEEKVRFFKQLCLDINPNFKSSYGNCISNKCHFLRGRYLYPCSTVSLLYENKDFLGIDIDKKIVKNSSFDLINGEENGWKILGKITEPFPFCMYCSSEKEWFTWSRSDKMPTREDWIVTRRIKYDNNYAPEKR